MVQHQESNATSLDDINLILLTAQDVLECVVAYAYAAHTEKEICIAAGGAAHVAELLDAAIDGLEGLPCDKAIFPDIPVSVANEVSKRLCIPVETIGDVMEASREVMESGTFE